MIKRSNFSTDEDYARFRVRLEYVYVLRRQGVQRKDIANRLGISETRMGMIIRRLKEELENRKLRCFVGLAVTDAFPEDVYGEWIG